MSEAPSPGSENIAYTPPAGTLRAQLHNLWHDWNVAHPGTITNPLNEINENNLVFQRFIEFLDTDLGGFTIHTWVKFVSAFKSFLNADTTDPLDQIAWQQYYDAHVKNQTSLKIATYRLW